MQKKFDVTNKHCPSHNVLAGIGDKWSILVLSNIARDVCRFGELKRQTGGISKKMLAQTLLKLEQFKLISRHDYEELPLRVEYRLTSLGVELSKILQQLTEWTEQNMEFIWVGE